MPKNVYEYDFNDGINAFDPCILLILKFFTMHISIFALNIYGILFSFTLFSWRNTRYIGRHPMHPQA